MAWIEKRKKTPRKPNIFKKTERQEIYQSTLWKKMRREKLRSSPLCEVCLIEDRIKGAEHVHHLRSFMGISDKVERDAVAYDPENLMTVCEVCHGRLHGGDLKGCFSEKDIRERLNK